MGTTNDSGGELPRKTPCASCPYRCGVPSGVWDRSEYDKLPAYDGDIPEQTSAREFSCHQQDGTVCAGWLGHRDPLELLAVRIGIIDGSLDPSCAEYSTTVPLWPTGADAARHGIASIDAPDERAQDTIAKLERTRDMRERSDRA
ncbi:MULTISPECIES: DUF6283 family protein [Brachybacterium]|uniref:DUF6283 family protein n=1 Tax=Brachybacterium kimchii TaxID=2942909 RepID=A0ABY4N9S4_9MICO|nr:MULTISPECIES: DUF6283 family protein [Brachybacterium]MCG7309704.1 DUF6283 family protein [Brachybacterium sp. ACRRE]UQN30551.1 DUF6283 family protein [Brachybacterium kimchii]